MLEKTFYDQFNEQVALINQNNNAAAVKNDKRVSDAFDDLSEALGLTHHAVALLVWALNNMNGEVVDISEVASQIDYSESIISSSLTELELHHYMVKVSEASDALDVTAKTKEVIINHYCFYKLLNS